MKFSRRHSKSRKRRNGEPSILLRRVPSSYIRKKQQQHWIVQDFPWFKFETPVSNVIYTPITNATSNCCASKRWFRSVTRIFRYREASGGSEPGCHEQRQARADAKHTGEDCLPDTATPTLIVEPLDWSAAAARTVLSRQRLRRRAFRGLDTWDSTWNIDCSQPASNVREMSVRKGGSG